jgi:hypothetical protein
MFSYGEQGLQFDDGTGNNFLWFGVRLQTRWSNSEVTQDAGPIPRSRRMIFPARQARVTLTLPSIGAG